MQQTPKLKVLRPRASQEPLPGPAEAWDCLETLKTRITEVPAWRLVGLQAIVDRTLVPTCPI